MVHFQWPVKWGKKKEDMSQELEDRTRIEAGLTEIKGTHFLMKRIKFQDDFFDAIVDVLEKERDTLLNKKVRSPSDEKRLDLLRIQLVNVESYRVLKKSSTAWGIAGEDNDMSERYNALEKLFARRWFNPHHQALLFMAIHYTADISFSLDHVKPAPSILVQNLGQGPRISLERPKKDGKE